MKIEELKQAFKDYAYKFDMDDEEIALKFYHSNRVMDICLDIAKHYNFDETDYNVAGVIGLLHDYARFTQWTNFKTYSDLKSFDHADEGAKLLFDNNEIVNFYTKEEDYNIIHDAIKYHNKLSLPECLEERDLKMCKLIRDADKIDIIYNITIDKSLLPEDGGKFSDAIVNNFYEHKCADYKDIKCDNDNILTTLMFMYDINFPYSFKYIKDHKLIENMYDNIENKELFKEYFDYIINYIDEKSLETEN